MSTIPEMVKELTDEDDFDFFTLRRMVKEQDGKILEDPAVVSEGRWSLRKRAVITLDPKAEELYGVEWSEGATEYQEDTDPEPEVYRVAPYPSVTYVRESGRV